MTLVTATPPSWLTDLFEEIDSKRFGAGFDILAPDATMRFGVATWHGREEIRAHLRGFDDVMDTTHVVTEFLDGGDTKVFGGEVEMVFRDGRPTVRPALTHIVRMSPDGERIVAMFGSVGPLVF